jgi:hypothetical protein
MKKHPVERISSVQTALTDQSEELSFDGAPFSESEGEDRRQERG